MGTVDEGCLGATWGRLGGDLGATASVAPFRGAAGRPHGPVACGAASAHEGREHAAGTSRSLPSRRRVPDHRAGAAGAARHAAGDRGQKPQNTTEGSMGCVDRRAQDCGLHGAA